MFILRLLDKHFKNVEGLEVNKFFSEPYYRVTSNLQSIKQLNVHSYESNRDEIVRIFALFPNLQELMIPYVFLLSDGYHEYFPEAKFLKNLVVSKCLIYPPNILSKFPNLAQLIIRGKGDGSKVDTIFQQFREYLPNGCDVTFEPLQESEQDYESTLLQEFLYI